MDSHRAALDKSDWDTTILIVPMLLYNLECLSIKAQSGNIQIILNKLRVAGATQSSPNQQLRDSPYALSRLNKFSITMWGEGRRVYQLQIDQITPLLMIPSLVTFSCDGLTDAGYYANNGCVMPIKSLMLENCGISFSSLSILMDMCQFLEELYIGHSLYNRQSNLTPARIFERITGLKDTLSSLTIIDQGDVSNNQHVHSDLLLISNKSLANFPFV